MSLMTDKKTIDFYTNLIATSVDQPYLRERLAEPALDKHKIMVLHELTRDRDNHVDLVHATMLVQIALDTHDNITHDFDESNQKEQQLTVLAGDYYSGIYYHLLSKQSNLAFIRLLADAISEMTQRKLTTYYREHEDVVSFLTEYQSIETKLMDKVASFVDQSACMSYLTDWILLKRMEYEIQQLKDGLPTFLQRLMLRQIRTVKSLEQLKQQLLQAHTNLWKLVEQKVHDNEYPVVPKLGTDNFSFENFDQKQMGVW